jgi:hypothetical protein
MAVVIESSPIYYGQSILFTISSGASSCNYASFEWYLNGMLVGTESSYILLVPSSNDSVYVKVTYYPIPDNPYWRDGQFYGGVFKGNFDGGTFHYGMLNGCVRTKPDGKPKPFIKK